MPIKSRFNAFQVKLRSNFIALDKSRRLSLTFDSL